MKRIGKYILACAFALTMALPALAGSDSLSDVMANLDSPKERTVVGALQAVEKQYPTDANALAKVKSLLADPRQKVRSKAGRVLGAIHADVSDTDLKNIAAMLDSMSKDEVLDALKSLRGLKAQSVVPKIVPLLKNPDPNIERDSCRTLAVIGDKSIVPDIQPLLQSPDKAVVKDANDAIFALKNK